VVIGLAADAPAPVAVQRAGARSQGVGSDSFGTARSSYHKETYYQIQKKWNVQWKVLDASHVYKDIIWVTVWGAPLAVYFEILVDIRRLAPPDFRRRSRNDGSSPSDCSG